MRRFFTGPTITAVVIASFFVALLLVPQDGRTVAGKAAGSAVHPPVLQPIADSPPPRRITVPDRPRLKILFVGDSLSGSVFATTQGRGWVPRTVLTIRRLRHAQVTSLVPTKIGRTPGKARGANDILAVPSGADMAFLEIGTNDVNHVSPQQFAINYHRLLSMIRRTSPGAKLVCLGVWSVPGQAQPAVDEYNGIIARACGAAGGIYFPLTDIWRNPGFHGPVGRKTWDGAADGFHPNDAGYSAIAARVREHLKF